MLEPAPGHSLPAKTRLHFRLQPSYGWVSLKLREVWQFRELLYFLTWRDIKVRYKQTVLGASWAILQPLFTMVIFTVFFGNLGKIPSDNQPYALFSYTGLLPWTFFANGLTMAANSLVSNSNMLKKVYFPRLALPISTVLAGVVDFVLAFVLLIGLLVYYGIAPTANLLWLPYFILLAFITTLGVGLWLSAMNVQFRDLRYAVPFLIQAWLFITPIVYPSSLLAEPWRTLYALNPMAGVVEGFRWTLLGTESAPTALFIVSTAMALMLLFSGGLYFRRMERTFADVV